MFPFRGADYADANKDPTAKLYFRNFRVEQDNELGDPVGNVGDNDLVVANGLPIDDNQFKVVEQPLSKWGKGLAPDNAPAYFIFDALSQGGSFEIEFMLTPQNIDFSKHEYLVFDITADTFNLLNALEGFYPRLKRSGDWQHVQFYANNVLRGAIDTIGGAGNFTSQWLTIKIPIAQSSGMNIHDAGHNYAGVIDKVAQIMPRFILSQGFRDNPTKDKLYFRNFRLEGEVPAAEMMNRKEIWEILIT
jgi:hypothetical protein